LIRHRTYTLGVKPHTPRVLLRFGSGRTPRVLLRFGSGRAQITGLRVGFIEQFS
jgi:hypothetical protein